MSVGAWQAVYWVCGDVEHDYRVPCLGFPAVIVVAGSHLPSPDLLSTTATNGSGG